MPSILETQKKLQLIADDLIAAQHANLADVIAQLSVNLSRALGDPGAAWDAYGQEEVVAMVEAALEEAGFGALADDFASAALEYKGALEALPAVAFKAEQGSALAAALNAKYEGWDRVAQGIIDKTRQLVSSATVTGIPGETLAAQLVKEAGALEQHARTYIETAQQAQLRESWIAAGQSMGAERYEYVGPMDDRTRPFCRDLLNQGGTHTLEDVGKMKNGQSLSVVTYGGGWNCRHDWVPVLDTEE
jgi:hypothetical protein